jgi:hypothetical protein
MESKKYFLTTNGKAAEFLIRIIVDYHKGTTFSLTVKEIEKHSRKKLSGMDPVSLFYKTYNSIKKGIDKIKH